MAVVIDELESTVDAGSPQTPSAGEKDNKQAGGAKSPPAQISL